MYKFIMVQGDCGGDYDMQGCEEQANKMDANGYDLVQVYQSRASSCVGRSKSILVMVFKKR